MRIKACDRRKPLVIERGVRSKQIVHENEIFQLVFSKVNLERVERAKRLRNSEKAQRVLANERGHVCIS